MKQIITLSLLFFAIFQVTGQIQEVYYKEIGQDRKETGQDLVNIIHITDLHINTKDHTTIEKLKLYCKDIQTKFKGTKTYTILTGDFSYKKNDDIIQKAADFDSVDVILKNHFEDSNFTILVCPGNHDYGNGGCRTNNKAKDKFKEMFLSKEITFPIVTEDTVSKLVFIGLNTMYGMKMPLQPTKLQKGKVGQRQKKKLKSKLEEYFDYKKIVYMHHAVFTNNSLLETECEKVNKGFCKQLFLKDQTISDSSGVRRILSKNKVDLLLNGHRHSEQVFKESNLQIVESRDLQNEYTTGYYVITIK